MEEELLSTFNGGLFRAQCIPLLVYEICSRVWGGDFWQDLESFQLFQKNRNSFFLCSLSLWKKPNTSRVCCWGVQNHLNEHDTNLQNVNADITTNTKGSFENKSWSTPDGLNHTLPKCIAPVNCWLNTQHYHIGRQEVINTSSTNPTTMYFRDQIHQSYIKQYFHWRSILLSSFPRATDCDLLKWLLL